MNDLQLLTLSPQFPECWVYRCVPAYLSVPFVFGECGWLMLPIQMGTFQHLLYIGLFWILSHIEREPEMQVAFQKGFGKGTFWVAGSVPSTG